MALSPNSEFENDYALTIKDEVRHISEVESGRKGYFCMGCKREMQAVISKKQYRLSYFRHDAEAVKNLPKCTYSSETHRHSLAKQILQIIKKIKVPPIVKFPPNEIEGKQQLIEQSKFVEAEVVHNELYFYENEFGEIKWGRSYAGENEFLLIQPDIAFFDSEGTPILLIEIVATHKVSDDKSIKLKRLGINTVQVTVPKGSPEEIESRFFTSQYTKWVYNHVEQNTEYISTSCTDSEAIQFIDEEQRKLFTESFACRSAEIKSLIRSIRRSLESQQYREAEQFHTQELSRVKRNTDDHKQRWAEIQDELQNGVNGEHENEIRELRKKERDIETQEREFSTTVKNLEGRYFKKRVELEEQEGILDRRISYTLESLREEGDPLEQTEEDIKEKISKEDIDIASLTYRRNQVLHDTGEIPGRIERLREQARNRFEEARKSINGKFESGKEFEESEMARIEGERKNLPGKFKAEEGRITEEFIRLRENTIEATKGRDCSGTTEFSRRIKALFNRRQRLYDIQEAQASVRGIRKAWECFKSGTWKSWEK